MSVSLILDAGKLKNAKMPKMAKKHRVPPYEFFQQITKMKAVKNHTNIKNHPHEIERNTVKRYMLLGRRR